MSSSIRDVDGEIFRTRSEVTGQHVRVVLTGCLDMETAPEFERYLGGLGAALASEGIREVEFDTAGLYLMSSSAISHAAAWLKRIKGLSPTCRIKFKTNPNLAWQRRTFESIRRVAEALVAVE